MERCEGGGIWCPKEGFILREGDSKQIREIPVNSSLQNRHLFIYLFIFCNFQASGGKCEASTEHE